MGYFITNFIRATWVNMAKGFWKRACEAGDISPEDAANLAYRDGFVTGAFAVMETMSRISNKDLKEILLSGLGATDRRLLLLGWAHRLLDEANEHGWGGPARNDPCFERAFLRGAEISFSNVRQVKKLGFAPSSRNGTG